MRLVSSSLRRTSGSDRTPANSSASVTEVMATSPSRDASQSTGHGSGNGRKISEITFVRRMINRSPRPERRFSVFRAGERPPKMMFRCVRELAEAGFPVSVSPAAGHHPPDPPDVARLLRGPASACRVASGDGGQVRPQTRRAADGCRWADRDLSPPKARPQADAGHPRGLGAALLHRLFRNQSALIRSWSCPEWISDRKM